MFSVPKLALTMLFGAGADMFLASTHVTPQCLLESHYRFQYPELEQALKKYLLTNI
jgi:NAD dependent epimerase/dehydratase family enzyme